MRDRKWKFKLASKRSANGEYLDIYCIDGAGNWVCLMRKHYNKALHVIIPENGVPIGEIMESKPKIYALIGHRGEGSAVREKSNYRSRSRKGEAMITHILKVFDDYLTYEAS